ncbi:MAG: prepilin-type N-terminal cleavage/methylation domain-containing protein [Candidatus Nealsonbacteria bacterium]|nr:prepilin-type N-terminal cleavage/methylation domain-containing protein [Candidatus Nealsonbacteria bacterium]
MKKRAFTLIELLVVIAIIGLLSSAVLISVNIARESAKIAALKEFSVSIYHALGSDIVAYWNFNGDLKDSSGNNHNLDPDISYGISFTASDTISGQALLSTATSFSTVYSGKSLKFDSGSVTGEFWIKITDSGYNDIPVSINNMNSGWINYNNNYAGSGLGAWQFYVYDADGHSGFISLSYSSYKLIFNKWNHIVFSYDYPKRYLYLYLNGTIISSKDITSTNMDKISVPAGNSVTKIGGSGNIGLNTYVDVVRLYDAPLSLAEIRKHYAEEIYKIQLAELTSNYLLR